MAKQLLLEEFHLTVFAPDGLPENEYDAIHQTLDEPAFQAGLHQAAESVVQKYPSLQKVSVTLSR